MQLVLRAASALLDLVAPRECAACAEPAARGFCSDCRARLTLPGARAIDGVPLCAAASFAAPLDQAIHRFKYQRRADLAGALAGLVPRATLSSLSQDRRTLFVPVPLHPTRLAERGYDQAALLASAHARRAERRTCVRALRRLRPTDQQARLDGAARALNVVGAFAVTDGVDLAARPVVLVDDVITTGATAGECLRALRAARARVVAVLTIASTPG